MVKLIALDVAGTTIDEGGAVYESLKNAIETTLNTILTAEELRPALGANKREAIAGFLNRITGEATPERVESIYNDFRDRLIRSYNQRPPRALPGVESALTIIRAAGIKVALTTGFSKSVTDTILAAAGWTVGNKPENTVDAVVTSDQVSTGRPSPEMIFTAMTLTGVNDVTNVLVAGDTELDLAAAANAGVKHNVAVSTGAQSITHLSQFAHSDICDVKDLPEFLGLIRPITVDADHR